MVTTWAGRFKLPTTCSTWKAMPLPLANKLGVMPSSKKSPTQPSLVWLPPASAPPNSCSKALERSPILARGRNVSDKSRPTLSPVTSSMAARERLDVLVWKRGLAPSRAKAQALILAGQIAVNGERTTRASTPVELQAIVTRLGAPTPYVSRGGEKLAAALAAFDLKVHQRVAMDVGASTGGFTDCLLQAGALRVYAVDVGYGQLHWRLRTDPRVIVYERTNARYLHPEHVPERIAVLTVDVSFISLRLILPVVVKLLEPQADSVVLIKPQFEVGKGQVGRSGVVHDPQQHLQVLGDILTATQDCGFGVRAALVSPLLGAKGNREFLAHLQLAAPPMSPLSLQELCARLALLS